MSAPQRGDGGLPVLAVEDPAAEAARRIAEALREAVAARGRATVAFSGGSSAPPLLDALASAPDLDWSRIDVLQVDERVAPDGHPDRNAGALLAHLVEPLGIPTSRVHLMPVAELEPEAAAAAYARTLERVTGGGAAVLDVVHLGLGDDGHTASLVPGDPVLDVVDADVAATAPYQGRRRVTLTFPAIDRARRRVWFVPAEGKGEALRRLEEGDPTIPGGRVRREGSVLVTSRR